MTESIPPVANVANFATFATLQDLTPRVGEEIATSGWIAIRQQQIDRFAEATGDRQWIHVDPERARGGPFGTTIAHGFLTLSLIPQLLADAVRIEQPGTAVNYGLGKVRFPAPVPVDSRLRGRFTLRGAEPVALGGVQLNWQVQIERDGHDKPVCVAESLVRYYPVNFG